jgi:hypothetical protein
LSCYLSISNDSDNATIKIWGVFHVLSYKILGWDVDNEQGCAEAYKDCASQWDDIAAKMPQAKTMLQRQVEATDRQVDNLVYGLYGLTDEEVRIVEESL